MNNIISLNCDIKTIIYMLVDIMEFLLSVEEKEINILIEKENQSIIIKICNKITNNEIIEKVKKISEIRQPNNGRKRI